MRTRRSRARFYEQDPVARRFSRLRSQPMHAELAYLFRHALMRDAAYHLQMPADRARLHGLAFAPIEAVAG